MFTFQYAKDPIYNSEDGLQILLTVKWEEFAGELPFNATAFDPEAYGRQLYDQAKAGDFGPVAPYVKPITTPEQNKTTASELLVYTDWTSIADVANPQYSNPYLANQAEFLAYRSQLRAIAVNPPEGDVNWPVKPQAVWVTV